jgi:hypothetical protein
MGVQVQPRHDHRAKRAWNLGGRREGRQWQRRTLAWEAAMPAGPWEDCISPFVPVLLDSTGREVPQAATLSGGAERSSTEDYVSGTSEYEVQPGRYRFVLLTPTGGHGFERDLSIP